MSDREAFEKWLKKKWQLPDGYMHSWNGEGYSLGREQESWQVWQASREQKIEMILDFIGAIFVVLFPVLLWFLFCLIQGQ